MFSLVILLGLSFGSDAQVITTVAGSGSTTYSGDGGPATSAGIYFALGVSADASGNFYIACWGQNRVRKVDPSGTITTVAGTGTFGYSGDGGPATAALLSGPMQVFADPAGNVYLSDYYNHRIRKVSASGIITTIAGNGIAGYSGDGGQATAAEIQFPWGIVVDPVGRIFIGDYYNHRIRRVDTNGIITTYAGTGFSGFSGDGGQATAAQIYYPTGIGIDATGNLYLTDYVNQRVRKINTSGIISTIAGTGGTGFSGDGGAATAAVFNNPLGVTADIGGNIYISDFGNSRIRKINTSGVISTIAGSATSGFSGDGGPATAAKLMNPYTIAFDPTGNLLIADSYNYRVRKINNGNRVPYFTGGISQNLTVCANTTLNPVNSLLAVIDSDAGQLETWALLSGPYHGTASISDTAISTGGTILPAGLTYAPTPGYGGNDTFRVTVNDGSAFDTITIFVTVNPPPSAIAGGTTVNIGSYTTLSDATAGGTWSSSSIAIASIGSASGVVSGISVGVVTITYTLTTTGCITATTVNVVPYAGQIITTIAGNGIAGFAGDGGAATSAKINQPWGVAVDASGNTYIADYANHRVRKVSSSGIITTIAGTGVAGFSGDGGPASSAQINMPYDVTVDAAGNVYIADDGNFRVRKINTSGIISSIAGNGLPGFSGDGGPATAAAFTGPSCIALDATGNIYISVDGTRVRKISTSGIITTFAGNGTIGYSGDGGPATSAQLHNPVSVTADALGNIYIADQLNNYVRKVNSSGIISTIAGTGAPAYGGDGGAATSAALNTPWGIAADAAGNIYIGDQLNNRVRKINSAGIISTVAGTGTPGYSGDACAATTAQVNHPAGLAVDGSGNVYIGDLNNNVVRRISNNHAPAFIGGHSQNFSVCQDSPPDSINALLAVTDADIAQGETWSVVTGPLHGTLVAAYSSTSTGGMVNPVGLYYQPGPGYSGVDSFKIQVADCGVAFDTTVIHVTVNPPPSAISGVSTVCIGNATLFTVTVGTGTWSSSNTAIATVGSSSGIVSGVSAGTANITFSPGVGCIVTRAVTVNPLPSVITGSSSVCVGLTTTFSDSVSGGSWSSSNPVVATVGSSTGIVAGITSGFVNITYTLSTGCFATKALTVNAIPSSITGVSLICVGATSVLFCPGGGTWSSSAPSVATVGSSSGFVTGVSAGTAVVTYSLGVGCTATVTMTVAPNPGPIAGATTICAGLTTTLTDPDPGGFWSTPGFAFFASVDSVTGVVTGLSPGVQTILYTLGTGCSVSAMVTVSSMPSAIGGTPSVCAGASTTLFDFGGGTWSSSNPLVAVVGSSSGVVTGVTAGIVTISYAIIPGCAATVVATVNPLPAIITGSATICVGLTSILMDAIPGGLWSSSNTTVATVGSASGTVFGVSPGTSIITYTLSTGCSKNITVTVNSSPGAIGGATNVCVGQSILLTNSVSGGTWGSSAPAIASIGSTSGLVSGLLPGAVTITYSLGAGCMVSALLTVNPLPSTITGTPYVCLGASTTLADATPGGIWSSATPLVAVIGSSTGVVSGVGIGVATISYTLSTGCAKTMSVTVNPLPAVITGAGSLCVGSTANLTDASPGGTWSCVPAAVAIIGSSSGVVAGISPGTANVTYTLSTGCSQSKTVTVNPLPVSITGASSLCAGANITLADGTPGGTWSTTATTASVDFLTGVVTGLSAGTATITYTISSGCAATKIITVNPMPSAIGGPSAVCVGANITLTDADPGGSWTSSLPVVATIGSTSGIVTGASPGSSSIVYTLPTGCSVTGSVTVSLSPSAIFGSSSVCTGAVTTLTNGVPGGVWTSAAPGIASVGSLSGLVSGTSAGIANITYSLGTGCTVYKTISVNPSPLSITGTLSLCGSSTSVLSDPTPGGAWTSTAPLIATVSGLGVVTGISPGTTTINYTIVGTGCFASAVVTINTVPSVILGTMHVCVGSTTTLSDGSGGGAWSIVPVTTASIGSSSGLVTGILPGVATVTYSLGTGCTTTTAVTVQAVPSVIGGSPQVCTGLTTLLTDATPGGSWSSSSPGIATVGAGTGLVTGVTPGITTISYTLGSGCAATAVVTVNALPPAISGAAGVCAGLTTTLSDGTPGGTWSSSNIAVATIGTATGVLSALTAGTTNIVYTLSTGCSTSMPFVVNSAPAPVTGTASMCIGSSTTLYDATPGGTWTSGNPAVATVSGGVVTSVSVGTATISYNFGGCSSVMVVTVNSLPGSITGTKTVCVASTTTLSDLPAGGSWFSGSPGIATIGIGTGIVTGVSAGTSLITYSLGVGCTVTTTVTVNPLPSSISGPTSFCIGSSAALVDGTPGGTWSSSNTAIATIGTSGIVTGVSGGTATMSYTLPLTGCATVYPISVVSVPDITGVSDMCAWFDTITVHNTDTTGIYTSTLVTVSNLGGGAAYVLAHAPGTATIFYTIPSGCVTSKTFTINPLPGPITGNTQLCIGLTTTLSDGLPGGTWSSGNTAIATAGSTTGIISGISAGITNITYTLATGCKTDTAVEVHPQPSLISGAASVCAGATTVFTDSVGGGTWSSSNIAVATAGTGGLISGITAGTAIITYTMGASCMVTKAITVNGLPEPNAITGGGDYCSGGAGVDIGLSGSSVGVNYQLYNGTTAVGSPVAGTGSALDFGMQTAAGTYTVAANNATTSCSATMTGSAIITITATVVPSVSLSSSAGASLCAGTSTIITATPVNGGSSPSYEWKLNGIVTGTTAPTYSYIPVDGDNVSVTLTSNANCATPPTAGNNIVITVLPVWAPVVTITASPGTSIGVGMYDTLTATVTNGGPSPSYQWTINSIAVPGATTSVFIYNHFSNLDTVRCNVTGTGICGVMGSSPTAVIMVGNVGVRTISMEGDISVVPNPNKGTFTIRGSLGSPDDQEVTIEITDMLGRVVHSELASAPGGRLNTNVSLAKTLANGMYLLNLRSDSGNNVFHIVVEQ